jgi:hypothetical protein
LLTDRRSTQVYPFETPVIYPNGQPQDDVIASRTIKMVDSGIFGKNGCDLNYDELFREYDQMNADYGVIIDVLRDAEATLASAKTALAEYRKSAHKFKLVGVAQGTNPDGYYRCYERLKELGFECIAIGGLLRKRKNTVRYVQVRCEDLLENVLRGVRKRFDPAWLFVLGALHPGRLDLFVDAGVWGSDYKGWIFNYEKKDTVIELIRKKKLASRSRVALKSLRIADVRRLDEKKLRFTLARASIEKRVMYRIHGPRLLIVGCSARKRPTNGKAIAWDVYDGNVFRTLKAVDRASHLPPDLEILILSAKHGLMPAQTRIARYDQRMSLARADELASQNRQTLREVLGKTRYREVFLCMGQTYLESLQPFSVWAESRLSVRVADGRIGEKLRKLKHWVTTG